MDSKPSQDGSFETPARCALLRQPLVAPRTQEEEEEWLHLCWEDFDPVPHESADA